MVVGAGLAAAVAVGGVYLANRPDANGLDRWFLDRIPLTHNRYLTWGISLRYPAVIVAGSVVLALLTVWRDRARALGCLVGPPLALIIGELVIKPAVGRTLGGVLSYPSGSTAGAAALATAAVLASPLRWRVVTIALASAYAVWIAITVIALRWHFPTDALGGLACGVGVVLVVDGAAWWGVRWLGLWSGHGRGRSVVAGGPDPGTPPTR